MKHTVIALFDKAEDAQKAAQAVKARGFNASSVHVIQHSDAADAQVIPPTAEIEGGPLTGLLHRLSVLFGVEEPHLAHYEEAMRRGGRVVQVDAGDEAQAATARDTLLALGAVDIDDRIAEWLRAGWQSPAAASDAAASTPVGAGPGSVVHRQEVSIGGVRVYGHVVVAAFDHFADDFRAEYEALYAAQGTTYDDFDAAYRYGHALVSDSRYDGRSWDEIEPQARADWERRYPQSSWQRFQRAVRHAWERTTRQ
ncbi:hypothetical protein [Aquabacterium sp.]|uniref:hypothetical protein n=1 Tax=Aquabacterium sp. TaxID=1872578 RepID=UPI002B6F64FF|nr:hypothetical protein [Aquabacterium sp.]HSW05340.1 hypothetical protein [Aquabacterium sp.]